MSVEPYSFAPGVEAEIVFLLATDPTVYNAFRDVLEIDAFPTREAQTILKAVTSAYHLNGSSPNSSLRLVQHLHHMTYEEGAFTIDAAIEAADFLVDGSNPTFTPEDAISTLRLLIAPRIQAEAVRSHLTGTSPEDVSEMFQRALTLGVGNRRSRSKMSKSWFDDIARLRLMEYLPTGCLPLDKVTKGFRRGHLTTIGAETNAGKSSFLRQGATMTSREGGVSLFITNETSEDELKLFLLADMTNIPFEVLLKGEMSESLHIEALKRYTKMSVNWGPIHVMAFEEGELTPKQVKEAIDAVKKEEGRDVDYTGIDYGDRMSPDQTGDFPQHIFYKYIWSGLETIAKGGTGVIATASQIKGNHKTRFCLAADLADSKHKGRISPTVWTLNVEVADGVSEYYVCVAKSKTGRSGTDVFVGPIENDFEFGRYSKLSRAVMKGRRPSEDLSPAETSDELNQAHDVVDSFLKWPPKEK